MSTRSSARLPTSNDATLDWSRRARTARLRGAAGQRRRPHPVRQSGRRTLARQFGAGAGAQQSVPAVRQCRRTEKPVQPGPGPPVHGSAPGPEPGAGRARALQVHSIVSAVSDDTVIIELRENVQQLKLDREERILDQSQVNKELIRNLAHEIKNPLGGIRGTAQLLELELPALHLSELREYTQVIIKEADRLQTLVDRLLAPHRRPHIVGDVNIHEVCERVRSLILAEFPSGLTILRDYDASIPEFRGDKEQLIQTVLNIAHNAAQALAERIEAGDAELIFKTRVARQVTLAKVRYNLALDLHIIDNGPGIAPQIRDRIFYPLVSGRDGGSGLGLTLAQTFVQQHLGVIECESRPGYTDFRIVLPLP